MKSKVTYEKRAGKTVVKNEYSWTPPAWKEELVEKCKNIGENPSPDQVHTKTSWKKY